MLTVKYQKLMLSLLCMLAVTGCNTPYLVQPAGESLTKLNAQDSYNYKSTSISVNGSKQPYLGLAPPTTMRDTPVHFWPLDFVNYRMSELTQSHDSRVIGALCNAQLYVSSVDYYNLTGGQKGSHYVGVGFNALLSLRSSTQKLLLELDISSDTLRGEMLPMSWEFRPSVLAEEFRMELVNVSTRAAKALVDKVLKTIDSVEQCQ